MKIRKLEKIVEKQRKTIERLTAEKSRDKSKKWFKLTETKVIIKSNSKCEDLYIIFKNYDILF